MLKTSGKLNIFMNPVGVSQIVYPTPYGERVEGKLAVYIAPGKSHVIALN